MAEATGAPLVFEEVEGVGHVDGILKYDCRGQSEVQRTKCRSSCDPVPECGGPLKPLKQLGFGRTGNVKPEVAKTETEDYFVICQRVATGC